MRGSNGVPVMESFKSQIRMSNNSSSDINDRFGGPFAMVVAIEY
jgi:hypothetical protein